MSEQPSSSPRFRGAIFDLDGVLVSTDAIHLAAWREMAAAWDFEFPESIADDLRGISRMESLEKILAAANAGERFDDAARGRMAAWKNERYRANLAALGPKDVLPGAVALLQDLKARGAALAIGSSSRNAREILERIGLAEIFDAIVDGNDIARGKPDPEVFLRAAARLGLAPAECVVVEDAVSGVEAALAAGCGVVAIGTAAKSRPAEKAVLRAVDLSEVTAAALC